jgi:protein ImuA
MLPVSKADILAQLQHQLEPLQSGRSLLNGIPVEDGPGPRRIGFPNEMFAFAAMHEFLVDGKETLAATRGFLSALLSTLMQSGGISIWISPMANLYPPALVQFGLKPNHIIFLHPASEKDLLWALEEVLKYDGLSAVVAEINRLSFTQSRRLQLAVEQSELMGLLVRNDAVPAVSASVSRWRITSLPSSLPEGMPGVGFVRWNAELVRMRNRKPCSWQVEWANRKFKLLQPAVAELPQRILQTG